MDEPTFGLIDIALDEGEADHHDEEKFNVVKDFENCAKMMSAQVNKTRQGKPGRTEEDG